VVTAPPVAVAIAITDAEALSALNYAAVDAPASGPDAWLPFGMDQLIDAMLIQDLQLAPGFSGGAGGASIEEARVAILYNQRVTAVDTANCGATAGSSNYKYVTTVNAATGYLPPRFAASAVIVTAPLGALKASAIAFSPPLPQRLQAAIHALSWGVSNNYYVALPASTPDAPAPSGFPSKQTYSYTRLGSGAYDSSWSTYINNYYATARAVPP
jgi:hypothetical protein